MLKGTLDDVREDPFTDPLVELRQVELGQPLLRIEHTVGVRQPHPGHFAGYRRGPGRGHQARCFPADDAGATRSQLSRRPSRARPPIRTRAHRPASLRPLSVKLSFPRHSPSWDRLPESTSPRPRSPPCPPRTPRRDHPFEGRIVEGMVFHVNGQPLLVSARLLWNGPALEYAVELQAEVIVKPPGGVLLHDEAQGLRPARAGATRLRGAREISLPTISLEGHGGLQREAGWPPLPSSVAG